MRNFLKQELRLRWQELVLILAFLWGFFAVGVAAVLIIVPLAADGTYAEMGTFVASLVAVLLLAVRFGFWGRYSFDFGVMMGRTRRAAIASLVLRITVAVAVCAVTIPIFSAIESTLYGALYPSYTNEIAMGDILSPGLLAGFACGVWLALIFVSALVTRYGNIGWLITWGIWLFCCLILPRLALRENESSPFFALCYRAMDALGGVTGSIGLLLRVVVGLAAVAGVLAAAWRMFMRAEVRF